MNGQYIRSMDRQLISKEDTFLWMLRGDLKGETESKIIVTQDRALQTKYPATKMLQTETDNKCRPCKQFDETVDNIVSACTIWTQEQCVKRHDRVCDQLRFNICVENRGKIRQQTLVITCTKISRN
jgi:hypothetical protein